MAARGQGLEQDFDFFVVVDFEATCVKDARIFPQEIIEFPAVLVDSATGRIESTFRRELTGIRQEDVDGNVDLGEALWLHDTWLKAATAGAGNKRRVRLAIEHQKEGGQKENHDGGNTQFVIYGRGGIGEFSRLHGAQRLAKSTAYGGEQATLHYLALGFYYKGYINHLEKLSQTT
ncbi:ERI1 exoribonuclease 2 [Triticum urartu]|uniref:ERI1 exoribonuclease 2 n=1 Tax=Triticum urartu TaxID=4572 RepID=M7YP43_TRIUA|nr:ERI1 exoribonuclease 2 [Triticum urartu]